MIQEQKVLTYKGQIVFEKVVVSNGFKRLPKFYNENEACFMFVNKGEFSIRTPEQFLSFEKGKGFFAKCYDYFFETNETQRKSNETIEIVGVSLYPSVIEDLFQFDVTQSAHTVDYNSKQFELDALLNSFKDSISILIDNPELADAEMIRTKLKEFILLLCKTQKIPSHLEFLAGMFKTATVEFRTAVNNNLYANLSIDEFAHLCGMSVSSFKRKFTATFEESPKRYIARKKLEKATALLQSNEVRISDIAYDCGYETISTFNRSFKTRFGMSPSGYRVSQLAQSLS